MQKRNRKRNIQKDIKLNGEPMTMENYMNYRFEVFCAEVLNFQSLWRNLERKSDVMEEAENKKNRKKKGTVGCCALKTGRNDKVNKHTKSVEIHLWTSLT
jgi:hypothetical protein